MESLQRRAKAQDISRSEGLRRALRQWTADEEREFPTAEDHSRRIIARLDELREEILLLGLSSGRSPQTSTESGSRAKESTDKANTGGCDEHIQMQLYEGEELAEPSAQEEAGEPRPGGDQSSDTQ